MRQVSAAIALLVMCTVAAPLRGDDPVSSSVTFNREVYRIFERKCLPCHAPGAVAMSLATYREARPWARAIREELIEQRMPPWRAAPGYGAFANDIGLTPRELTVILTWTDGGVPKGDDRDLPRRAEHSHDSNREPDERLALPVQRIPAGEEHVIRRVTIDPVAAPGQWLGQVEVVPGDTRVMRAAFVSIISSDGPSSAQWIGGWTPWLRAIAPPEGAAFPLRAGDRLLVELHYRGRETVLEDRSSVALFFAPERRAVAGSVHVVAGRFHLEAGATRRVKAARQVEVTRQVTPTRRGEWRLRDEARIWAILPRPSAETGGMSAQPHGDADSASSIEVAARKPDGSVDVLLWIPQRRHDWPTPYILQTPVLLPAGTTIILTAAAPPGTRQSPPLTVTLSAIVATAVPSG